MRTGIGLDIHAFAEWRKLFLGGVQIEHEKGLMGHSDADVVLHAIADALLGGAALGDIGRHFPDTDPQYKDISSLTLLERTARLIADEGWQVGNVDVVIACEKPKIASHIGNMRRAIAGCLGVDEGRISVRLPPPKALGI